MGFAYPVPTVKPPTPPLFGSRLLCIRRESNEREKLIRMMNTTLEQKARTGFEVHENHQFPQARVSALQCVQGELTEYDCPVICESTFTVVVNGKPLSHLQCSNNALAELAYGFLFNEGVITGLDDVKSFELDAANLVAGFEVTSTAIDEPVSVRSSGFGGFALALPESTTTSEDPVTPDAASFSMSDVSYAITTMQSFAREYTITRRIHCSALFAGRRPLASFEDIGRHNTFDKLAGASLLQGFSTQGTLLTTTGRVSSEMVRKTIRLGVAGIASLSGPTDQAIELARTAGLFLAVYIRNDSGTIYTR